MTAVLDRESGSRAPTAIDLHVGEALRRFRIEDNLTLQELANALGISHQQLQKYETGTNRMSAGMLHATAGVLQRPITAFFPDGAPDDLVGRLRAAERQLEKIRHILGA